MTRKAILGTLAGIFLTTGLGILVVRAQISPTSPYMAPLLYWGIGACVVAIIGFALLFVFPEKAPASVPIAIAGDGYVNTGTNTGHLGPVHNYPTPKPPPGSIFQNGEPVGRLKGLNLSSPSAPFAAELLANGDFDRRAPFTHQDVSFLLIGSDIENMAIVGGVRSYHFVNARLRMN